MPDGVTYAEQCLACCFMTSTKQKPSMPPQNLTAETVEHLPPRPHHSHLASNGLDLRRVGTSHWEKWMMTGNCRHVIPQSCPLQGPSVLFCPLLQSANFAWEVIISFASFEFLPFYQPNQRAWRQTSKIKTKDCVSLKLLHSQAAKVRQEPMEWRIHLQTYTWSEGKIQNTQGTCHSKEQIIRCLNAWTTLVDIFPKNVSDTKQGYAKVLNTRDDQRKSNQNQKEMGIMPHGGNAATQETKARRLPPVWD